MIGRRVLVLVVAWSIVACGSEEDHASSHGTIAGERFDPVDATAFVMEPMRCEQLDGWNTTIVMVQFGNFEGLCDVAVDTAFCGVKGNAKTAYVAVVRANVNGGPVPSITPGTYSDAGTHVVDEAGVVQFFWTGLDSWDASCAPVMTGMYKEPTGGSITLDEVGATRLRGYAEISFDNGDTLSGSFDVPVCPSSDNEQCAALKGGCADMVCGT